MKEFFIEMLITVCFIAIGSAIILLITKIISFVKTKRGNTAQQLDGNEDEVSGNKCRGVCDDCEIIKENKAILSGESVSCRDDESYLEKCKACALVVENKELHANFKSNEPTKRIRLTFDKSLLTSICLILVAVCCVYSFYRAFIYPSFKTDDACLEMLNENRDRLLEYEPMGKIEASNGMNYNIYHKDGAYYIYNDIYGDLSHNNRRLSLSYYAYLLAEYGEKNRDEELEKHTEMLDKYIRLTPCTYYDDRGHNYNYCFFYGSDRVYFNI